jgi:hypothetical protein
MKWFGTPHGAAYESDTDHAATPIGVPCTWCGEAIAKGEDGFLVPLWDQAWSEAPYHYECHMRSIVGGVNHLRKHCMCCGGTDPPDPPELTTREAARQAVQLHRRMMTEKYPGHARTKMRQPGDAEGSQG